MYTSNTTGVPAAARSPGHFSCRLFHGKPQLHVTTFDALEKSLSVSLVYGDNRSNSVFTPPLLQGTIRKDVTQPRQPHERTHAPVTLTVLQRT